MLDKWSLAQRPIKKRVALAVFYRRMLNSALFIHALNSNERLGIERLQLRSPVQIIPNGVFLEEIFPLPPPELFRQSLRNLGNAPYIVFLGRLHHGKGLDLLASAFRLVAAKLPQLHMVIIGPDDGSLHSFQGLINAYHLSDRVHVTGPLYGPEKFAAIAGAMCFCLPSRQEGCSLAIIESLACGCPVVISHECHFPAVATERAGIVTSLSPANLAAAIRQLCTDHSLRNTMAQNANRLVRTYYTWASSASSLIAAYAEKLPSPYAAGFKGVHS
jgi:glycosyltransferase involved in cell wall biosynthesis